MSTLNGDPASTVCGGKMDITELANAIDRMDDINRKIDAGYVGGVRDDDADNAARYVIEVARRLVTNSRSSIRYTPIS